MANAPAKLCISRGTELPTELAPIWSGALPTNSTPCASSHSKQGVGKGADDLAVVIAVIGKAVGTDDRPACQIAEQQVGRIFNTVFLLDAGATAERDIAAADYCSLPTDDCADRPVAADREGCRPEPRNRRSGNSRRGVVSFRCYSVVGSLRKMKPDRRQKRGLDWGMKTGSGRQALTSAVGSVRRPSAEWKARRRIRRFQPFPFRPNERPDLNGALRHRK
jgi:hypothetical protein